MKRKATPRQPTLPTPADPSADFAPERLLARQLRQTNLDLLPVLHELLRTGNISRTARSFGITQPSVSKALKELRHVFQDELLVFHGRNVQLTDRAEALKRPLKLILGEIDTLVRPPKPFDPTSERLNVVIGAVDYVTELLAPQLTRMCGSEAPHVTFEFVEAAVRGPEDLSRIDFLFAPRGYRTLLGKRIGSMPLWRDDYVCIAAANSRKLPRKITPEIFRNSRHVGYQMRPGTPAGDVAMIIPPSTLEVARVCTVPNFLVLGAIVEKTDCLALMPRKLASELIAQRAIKIIELDYERRYIDVDVYWSLASNRKRGHDWVRDLFTRAATEII